METTAEKDVDGNAQVLIEEKTVESVALVKTVGNPQLLTVEKTVEIPETQTAWADHTNDVCGRKGAAGRLFVDRNDKFDVYRRGACSAQILE